MDSVSSPYQDSGGLSYTMPQKHPRLHWWHKVTHVEIRHRAAEHLLLQRQLRWVGHHAFNSYALKPTPSSCSLRRTSQWSAVAWRSYACGTWTTSVVSWTSATVQYLYCRRNWSSFLLTETHCILPTAWQLYNVSADQAAEDRRTRRHNSANPPTIGPICPQCSRICASEFGLRSHLRSHASRPHQQHS